MKTLFDTSVLVALCILHHPKHALARQWMEQAKNGTIEAFCSAHSLLELYSVLTRTPFKPQKISAKMAKKLIDQNVLPFVTLITLGATNYQQLLDSLVASDLTGGITYDAQIISCAKQEDVQQIVSANPKHFQLLQVALGYDMAIIGI